MVTKAGTNGLHGEVYGFLRNQNLNADNALSHSKLPLTQAQYGASLGGPIVKGRTFYFANFEQRLLNQDGLITVSQANVDIINAKLTAVDYPGQQIATGLYPNPVHNANFLARVDHRFSQNDQFNIRYSLYQVDSSNSRFTGGLTTASGGAALTDLDQTIAASNIYTLSSHTVNETRGQFTNSDLKAPANDPIGPAVSISGVATFGTASGSPTARHNRLYEVVDNLSHQAGAHALRFGVDFLYNDLTITYPRSIQGSYSFSSLNAQPTPPATTVCNFLNSCYTTFAQTYGKPVISQTNPNVGFYAQDEWHLSPRFTINAGLRYDLQFLQRVSTDTGNVSPRLGFAWSPFGTGKTVVRASFGLFYDRVPLRALANALLSSNNTTDLATVQQQSISLAFGQTGAPVFPSILASVPSNVLISFTTMNPNMQNAYSEQASLEIDQQVGQRSTFSVNYQHLRGAHLVISLNQNVPSCPASQDPVNLCRPNPTYQNNSQYSPAADSEYDGL
jgi:TonB dependent receptor